MDQQQISAIVSAQRAYFESGKTLCTCNRKKALKKLYDAIVSREKGSYTPLPIAGQEHRRSIWNAD